MALSCPRRINPIRKGPIQKGLIQKGLPQKGEEICVKSNPPSQWIPASAGMTKAA